MSQQKKIAVIRYSNIVKNVAVTESGSQNKKTPVREIHSCLAPCDECTGVYIDAISGTRLRVICHHQCHVNSQFSSRKEVEA